VTTQLAPAPIATTPVTTTPVTTAPVTTAPVTTARVAELHTLRAVVAEAAGIVEAGWLRHGWFVYVDERGERRVATSPTARRAQGRPVVATCLVGAVVQAGGGPAAARTQTVQRALELVWHTLAGGRDLPVRWCPAPEVRASHVHDLARWNDAPSRTRSDVVTLLHAAESRAESEIARENPR
jgi:hypothetical protein